ncbi:bifunctional DNA primase/polymerase [Streptomyces sp. TRM64462]|uniref:bifunctional DNA primase/polymerase n=1 Tax=Streptomyces sp. TRM64462 TaxID=2741726 RepID=UPI0015860367|nr:bifunctional DNA primase/polymerase [Streptomyces sp. TRM64462]
MREILGRRRRLLFGRKNGPAHLDAALLCATGWHWPVLPGVGLKAADDPAAKGRAVERGCACPDPECVVPGAHPFDPGLLAATTDPRMVRWWWTTRPDAPIVLATGGSAPCAVSLPAVAGARALAALDGLGVRLGPVVATPTRWSLLVAPYTLERLGELLYAKDRVPSSLRFHGEGGYLVLPPSVTGKGRVRWERAPLAAPGAVTVGPRAATSRAATSRATLRAATSRAAGTAAPGAAAAVGAGAPWLPDVETVVDALVEASVSAPDGGSRLRY